EEFEHGASAGRNKGYLFAEARLVDCRYRIATAYQGKRTLLRTRLRHRLGNAHGAHGKGRYFEHTHRAVPEDRAGSADDPGKFRQGLRADIQTHPAVRNLSG